MINIITDNGLTVMKYRVRVKGAMKNWHNTGTCNSANSIHPLTMFYVTVNVCLTGRYRE